MAIVTGYTADKMNEFNNASVVSGTVNTAGSLILKTRGGIDIDAGNVKGPKGDTGTITTAQLAPYVARWKAATAYAVGAQVIAPPPMDMIVTCLSAHTSSASFVTDVLSRWTGYIFAGTTAQRDALFPNPTTDAAIVALANKKIRYYNTTQSWWETYYSPAKTGLTADELLTGHVQGWYPEAGSDLRAHCGIESGFITIAGTTNMLIPMGNLLQNTKGRFSKATTDSIRITIGGYYRIFGSVYYSGATTPNIICHLMIDNVTQVNGGGTKPNANDSSANAQGVLPVKANGTIGMMGWTANATNIWGTTGYNGCRLTIEYAGPPLNN